MRRIGDHIGVLLAVVLVLIVASGCAHTAGYAGAHPAVIECEGKVALTGTGTVALGAGLGGASTNSFSITGDCGPGFKYHQGAPVTPVAPVADGKPAK